MGNGKACLICGAMVEDAFDVFGKDFWTGMRMVSSVKEHLEVFCTYKVGHWALSFKVFILKF